MTPSFGIRALGGSVLLLLLAVTISPQAILVEAEAVWMSTKPEYRVKVFPNLKASNFNYVDGATVSIEAGYQVGFDKLYFDYQGLFTITGHYSDKTGVLFLSGRATVSEYNNALTTIVFATTSESNAPRRITWTYGANTLYFPLTGHFYKFVQSPSISWQESVSRCSSASYFGVKGYLATVTSADEQNAIGSKVNFTVWLGGSDDTTESQWRWTTGPEGAEDSGKGRLFWTGLSQYAGGTAPTNVYSAWNRFQPDNGNGESQNFLMLVNTIDPEISYWADGTNTEIVDGYLCEFGGTVNKSVAADLDTYTGSVHLNFGCELYTNNNECLGHKNDGCAWVEGTGCIQQLCGDHNSNEKECVTDWRCNWNTEGSLGQCVNHQCSKYLGPDACDADPTCAAVGSTECYPAQCSDLTSACNCTKVDGCSWRNELCWADATVGCSGMDVIFLMDATTAMTAPFGRYENGFFGLTETLLKAQFSLTGLKSTTPTPASSPGMRVGVLQYGTGGVGYIHVPIGKGSNGLATGEPSELLEDLNWMQKFYSPSASAPRNVKAAMSYAQNTMLHVNTGRKRVIVVFASGEIEDADYITAPTGTTVIGVALKPTDPSTPDSGLAESSLKKFASSTTSQTGVVTITMRQVEAQVLYGMCNTQPLAEVTSPDMAQARTLCPSFSTFLACESEMLCTWDSAAGGCRNSACLRNCGDDTCSTNPSCFWKDDACQQVCPQPVDNLNETYCGITIGEGVCLWDYRPGVDRCMNVHCVGSPTEDSCIADNNDCTYSPSAPTPCSISQCNDPQSDMCTGKPWCAWNGKQCYTRVCENQTTSQTCGTKVQCVWAAGQCAQNYCGQYQNERFCQNDYSCKWDVTSSPAACGPATCTFYNSDPSTAQAKCNADSTKCVWKTGGLKDMCVEKTCELMTTSCSCSTLESCVWKENKCTDNRFVQCPGIDVIFLIEGSKAMLAPFGRHPNGYDGIIESIREWSKEAPWSQTPGMPGFRMALINYGADRRALYVPPDIGTGGNLTGDPNKWYGVDAELDWNEDNIKDYATSFDTVAIKPALQRATTLFQTDINTNRKRMLVILGHSEITDGANKIGKDVDALEALKVNIFSNVIRRFTYITPKDKEVAASLKPFASDPHSVHFLFTTIDAMKATLLEDFCDPSTGTGKVLGVSRDGELPCGWLSSKTECNIQASCNWNPNAVKTCPLAGQCPNLECMALPDHLAKKFQCHQCTETNGAFECSLTNSIHVDKGQCERSTCMANCMAACVAPSCTYDSTSGRCERDFCSLHGTNTANCVADLGCVWIDSTSKCIQSSCGQLRSVSKCRQLTRLIPNQGPGGSQVYQVCKVRYDHPPIPICEEQQCPNYNPTSCAANSAVCNYNAADALACKDRTCTHTTSEQCATDNTCYWDPFSMSCHPRSTFCVLSGYSEWAPCTSTCGPSSATFKKRAIVQFPAIDGATCDEIAKGGCKDGVTNCATGDDTVTVVASCANPPAAGWVPTFPGVPATKAEWPAVCSAYCTAKTRLDCIADNSCQWAGGVCSTKPFQGCLTLEKTECDTAEICSWDTHMAVCQPSVTICRYDTKSSCNAVSNCVWQTGASAITYGQGMNLPVQIFNPGQKPIFPFVDLSIDSQDIIHGATVTIEGNYQRGKDMLELEYGQGLRSQWFDQSGTLRLYGQGTVGDYAAAISSVSYRSTSTKKTYRRASWSFGNNTFYTPVSGHHYRPVAMQAVSYDYAKTWCGSKQLYGIQGYLATVTSQEENDLITTKALGFGWVSGEDKNKGIWRLDSGPEDGTQFWRGSSLSQGGSVIGSAFTNWAPPNATNILGEPIINVGASEVTGIDRLYLSRTGFWESRALDSQQVDGFVCEFGGAGGAGPTYKLGGSMVIGIGGCVPTSCVWHTTSDQCKMDVECHWHNGVCEVGCASRSTEAECGTSPACRWDTNVQPATCDTNRCAFLGVTACSQNKLCEWDAVKNCVYREGCSQETLQSGCNGEITCLWVGAATTGYCGDRPCESYTSFRDCRSNPKCRFETDADLCKTAFCTAGTETACKTDAQCNWNTVDQASTGYQPGGATVKPFSHGISPPDDITTLITGITVTIVEGFQQGRDMLHVDPLDNIEGNYVISYDPLKGVLVLKVAPGAQVTALNGFHYLQRTVLFSSESTASVKRKIQYVLNGAGAWSTLSTKYYLVLKNKQATSMANAQSICEASPFFSMKGSLAVVDNDADNLLLANIKAQGVIAASSDGMSVWSWSLPSPQLPVTFWSGLGTIGTPSVLKTYSNGWKTYKFAQWASGEPALNNAMAFFQTTGKWKAVTSAPMGVLCEYTPNKTTPFVHGSKNIVVAGCYKAPCLGLSEIQCSFESQCSWQGSLSGCGTESTCITGTAPASCGNLELCYWDYLRGTCRTAPGSRCAVHDTEQFCTQPIKGEEPCAWNPTVLRRNKGLGDGGLGACVLPGCASNHISPNCNADPLCQWLPNDGLCVSRLCGYQSGDACWRDTLCVFENNTQCTPSPCTGRMTDAACTSIDSCHFDATLNKCSYGRCTATEGKQSCQNDTACLWMNGACGMPTCNAPTEVECNKLPNCFFSVSRKRCTTNQCGVETSIESCQMGEIEINKMPCIWEEDIDGENGLCRHKTHKEEYGAPGQSDYCEQQSSRLKLWWLWVGVVIILLLVGAVIYRVCMARKKKGFNFLEPTRKNYKYNPHQMYAKDLFDEAQNTGDERNNHFDDE